MHAMSACESDQIAKDEGTGFSFAGLGFLLATCCLGFCFGSRIPFCLSLGLICGLLQSDQCKRRPITPRDLVLSKWSASLALP